MKWKYYIAGSCLYVACRLLTSNGYAAALAAFLIAVAIVITQEEL